MNKAKKYFLRLLLLSLSIGIGFIIALYFENKIESDFSVKKENIAKISLAAINPDRVDRLSKIIPEDISKEDDWVRLKEQSVLMGDVFSEEGIDSIYILAEKDNNFYFLAESTPDGDPLYVPAGALYQQPPKELLSVFKNEKAQYSDMYTDEYGTYVSYFSPVFNKFGKTVGVLGVDIDQKYYITQLQQALLYFWLIWLFICAFFCLIFLYVLKSHNLKKESVDSEKKIMGIINSINDGLVVVDPDLKIIFWNKESENIFGYNFEEVIGTKLCDLGLIKKATNLKTGEIVKNFHLSFEPEMIESIFEIELKNKKNTYYEISFDLTEINSSPHLVVIFHDISRRKKEQSDLEFKTAELEKLNNLMVGRELKMIELKKQISQIKN
jgi:PAS domain S-box-containing protein